MKEKLIFVMPASLETLLYASTVLSQYLITRMVTGRSVDNVIIVCRYEELHSYLKACWALAEVVTELTEQQVEEADFVFEFDGPRSYLVTEMVEKNLAESMAIQLGVGLLRFLPPVLVEDRPEEVGTILVAERNSLDETDDTWLWPFREEFIENINKLQIPVSFLGSGAGWEEMKTAVGRASVVVGVRSSVTLIAASANRLVMELSPDTKGHKEWTRKNESGLYRMVYGSLSDMPADFVWAQISKLISGSRGKKQEMAVANV